MAATAGGGDNAAAASGGQANASAAAPRVMELRFAPEGAVPPERVDWGDALVPLYDSRNANSKPWCTGTFVDSQLLLTAAHCLGRGALYVGESDGSLGSSPLALQLGGGRSQCWASCGGSGLDPRRDVATILVDSVTGRRPLALGRISGDEYPHMVLLGYRNERSPIEPRVVCRALVTDGIGEDLGGTAEAVPGDSGGPLVALTAAGRAVVLGTVSARVGAAGKWLFTPTPPAWEVPRPTGYSGALSVESFGSAAAFRTIQGCQ